MNAEMLLLERQIEKRGLSVVELFSEPDRFFLRRDTVGSKEYLHVLRGTPDSCDLVLSFEDPSQTDLLGTVDQVVKALYCLKHDRGW